MNIEKTFKEFDKQIRLRNTSDFDTSLREITKKLNKKYYESDSETDHCLIVGSIGRHTAVTGVSDVDIIFELPWDVYHRFDKHDGNGQSDLLQEIKNVLRERYPRTDIKGDGQVVDVVFDSYTIEVVPGFRNDNDSFQYPDSNDGGKWRTTDPLPEQKAVTSINAKCTSDNMIRLCNMMRVWKDHKGFPFGGLLIDTLMYNFLEDSEKNRKTGYSSSVDMLKDAFLYLSKEDPDKAYWLALGSNQQVVNSGEGRFVRKAKSAYNKLNEAKDDKIEDALVDIFGNVFDKCVVEESANALIVNKANNYHVVARAPFESFISELMPVDIRYKLRIDCNVTEPGFRDYLLSKLLSGIIRHDLSRNKKLEFFIANTNVPEPFDIYWKVRNRGPEAHGRERGQIFEGYSKKIEHTNFSGDHYVECYLVKNGICVARDRIRVPIDVNQSDNEHRIY